MYPKWTPMTKETIFFDTERSPRESLNRLVNEFGDRRNEGKSTVNEVVEKLGLIDPNSEVFVIDSISQE